MSGALACLLWTTATRADSTGITTDSYNTAWYAGCNDCHTGGQNFSSGLTQYGPNPPATYVGDVDIFPWPPQNFGGLGVSSPDAILSVGGPYSANTIEMTNSAGAIEITQSSPKPTTNDAVRFSWLWTPTKCGSVDIWIWMLAADGDGTPAGDHGHVGVAMNTISCLNAGDSCIYPGTCASGFCVDGVCCDSYCGGGNPSDCVACSAAAGASADGICTPLSDGSTCEGDDVCRTGASCQLGVCGAPVGDGTPCDDGNACTIADACAAGACTSGTTLACPSTDPCHGDTVCDSALGACPLNPQEPDGSSCPGGACIGGVCVPLGAGGSGGGAGGGSGGDAAGGGGAGATTSGAGGVSGVGGDVATSGGGHSGAGGSGGGSGKVGGSGRTGSGGTAGSIGDGSGAGQAPGSSSSAQAATDPAGASPSGAPAEFGGCGCQAPRGGWTTDAWTLLVSIVGMAGRRRGTRHRLRSTRSFG